MARNSAFGQVSYGELRYGGPIEEPNLWGQVLVSSLPFLLYHIKLEKRAARKMYIGLALVTILLAMIYTGSRGAIVAFAAIIPLLAIDMKIKPLNLLIGFVLFLSLLSILPDSYSQRFQSLNVFFQPKDEEVIQDESIIGRQAVMKAGIAMFMNNPVLGVGFGNFGLSYWDYATELGLESNALQLDYGPNSRFPHSLYVEIISETGLIGLLTFFLFFFTMFSEMLRIKKTFNAYAIQTDWQDWITALSMSILTFLISGMFLHGIFFRYIWILIGLAMAASSISDSTQMTQQFKTKAGDR
jgi:O-antigen ligase